MTFVPHTQDNAIAEVVFGLLFDRGFSPAELMAFANSHDKFSSHLPGVSRLAPFPLGIGLPQVVFQGASLTFEGTGTTFDRYGAAGNLEKRLRVDGNSVLVNDFKYTRWSDVSAHAFDLLAKAIEFAVLSKISLQSILLQYVDIFTWEGEVSNYNVEKLLVKEGSFFPKSIFDRGHLWHLHQGWFASHGLPRPGKVLERITSDGIQNEKLEPVVRVDCYLSYEFHSPIVLHPNNGAASSLIENLKADFDYLHKENKRIVSECFDPDVLRRIGIT